jgi:hypothetical protein
MGDNKGPHPATTSDPRPYDTTASAALAYRRGKGWGW